MPKAKTKVIQITQGTNPYSNEVQGKANEPICVAMLLERANLQLKLSLRVTLEEIVERLEANAPRVAVITGSPDQPAHVMDHETLLKAVASIWTRGGVPFSFGIPVLCDGTAQSNNGMCYSLASRNLVSAAVINQMESHSYHGAFVIQGCDKTPFAVLNGLASLDVTRRLRGEAPVFATFAPAHVLRGGSIPPELRTELEALARQAEQEGLDDLAEDILHTLRHILQCSSNQAFQGVFVRAVQAGLIDAKKHKEFEKRLAVHTCHAKGGICAFNGTGNSSRHVISALGLVHPGLEFLTEPPAYEQVDAAIQVLLDNCNDPEFSVTRLIESNIENAIRVHSTMGGSSNLMMHMIAAMIYAGYRFSIHDSDRIRQKVQVPDLMNYSLTEGRDIFALARQCCDGLIGGIDTVLYELRRNGVPIQEAANTMAGKPWASRLKNGKKLSADNVKENPIILSQPRRETSGIDILSGNFFESAVVKISGMSDEQFDAFDEKITIVIYFETEEEAVKQLLNPRLFDELGGRLNLSFTGLKKMYEYNAGKKMHFKIKNEQEAFDQLIEEELLRLAIVIAGQGPKAFGMPEMFTPMQHINHNRALKKIAAIISDGRYSGVSYGAAIGHVTPEAFCGGDILYLTTGDLLQFRLRRRKIYLLDHYEFSRGKLSHFKHDLSFIRYNLGEERLQRLRERRRRIDPTNWMDNVTDAAHGVTPIEIWNRADKTYGE